MSQTSFSPTKSSLIISFIYCHFSGLHVNFPLQSMNTAYFSPYSFSCISNTLCSSVKGLTDNDPSFPKRISGRCRWPHFHSTCIRLTPSLFKSLLVETKTITKNYKNSKNIENLKQNSLQLHMDEDF